jgi:aminomethyltransferase
VQEALAARLNVAIADISWRWRVAFDGDASETFVSRLVTRDITALAPGTALRALWLSDGGGVRGAGIVSRFGPHAFQLMATAPDAEWFEQAASAFAVTVRDVTEETGGLALVGPYAAATLKIAGLDAALEPLAFRRIAWRGFDITLSRWGEHGGYEIWCAPEDAILVWDRLMRAGQSLGIAPAGTAAMDVLDLEAGIVRPELDYLPARDGMAAEPHPAWLGLEPSIDPHYRRFNGREAHLAAPPARMLVGLEIASDRPAPFMPVSHEGRPVGRTLRSAYSPALRRAIALASVDTAASVPGTMVSLILPTSLDYPDWREVQARVTQLPFLPAPDQIAS